MNSLLRKLHVRPLLSSLMIWLASGTPLLAQDDEGPKGYVPSYLIIMFCVGLALLMICRSGKRSVSLVRRED